MALFILIVVISIFLMSLNLISFDYYEIKFNNIFSNKYKYNRKVHLLKLEHIKEGNYRMLYDYNKQEILLDYNNCLLECDTNYIYKLMSFQNDEEDRYVYKFSNGYYSYYKNINEYNISNKYIKICLRLAYKQGMKYNKELLLQRQIDDEEYYANKILEINNSNIKLKPLDSDLQLAIDKSKEILELAKQANDNMIKVKQIRKEYNL